MESNTPLFLTIAINTESGAYSTRHNAANVRQLQIISEALLQEVQRLNNAAVEAVMANGHKPEPEPEGVTDGG